MVVVVVVTGLAVGRCLDKPKILLVSIIKFQDGGNECLCCPLKFSRLVDAGSTRPNDKFF